MSVNMIGKTTEGMMLLASDRFGHILPKNEINTDVLYAPDSIALRLRDERMKATNRVNIAGQQEPSGKHTLEFINVWLHDVQFSWKRNRTAVSQMGIATQTRDITTGGKEIAEMFKAVPVDMLFSMTFWTYEREKMNDFIQEFMFLQQDDPNIDMFYDNGSKLELDILVDNVIQDDSTIENMFKEGKYWKHTFKFMVESWLFRGVDVRTVKTIIIDTYAVNEIPEPPAQVPSAQVSEEVVTESSPTPI